MLANHPLPLCHLDRMHLVVPCNLDRKSTRLNSSHRHLVCRLLLEKKADGAGWANSTRPCTPRREASRNDGTPSTTNLVFFYSTETNGVSLSAPKTAKPQ